MSNDKLTIDISHCARCDEDHNALEFNRFKKYPFEESNGTFYDYWALCPTLQEPILLTVTEGNLSAE